MSLEPDTPIATNSADTLSRRSFIAKTAAATVSAAVGAHVLTSGTQSAAHAAASGTINYAVVGAGPFSEVVLQKIAEFEKLSGQAVNIIRIPHTDLYQKVYTEVSARSGAYDLVQVYRPNFAAFGPTGLLMPLDDLLPRTLIDDLAANQRSYLTIKGKLYAAPHENDIRAMYYRTDIFAKHGLKYPTTWAEAYSTAGALTGKDTPYGLLLPGQADTGVYQLADFIWDAGGRLMNANGTPAFNDTHGVEALTYYVSFMKNHSIPPGTPNYTWQDTRTLFAEGLAAMVYEFDDIVPILEDPKSSRVRGKYDIQLMPAGPSGQTHAVNSGFLLGIPSSAKNATGAAKLIEWILSVPIQEMMMRASGSMSGRKSVFDSLIKAGNPKLPKASPYSVARWEFYRKDLALARELNEIKTTKWPQIQDALASAINEALTGSSAPKAALDAAAHKVSTIMAA